MSHKFYCVHVYRIAESKEKVEKVIDVDGSYLYKKYQRLTENGAAVALIDHPTPPLSGWETVSVDNHREYSEKIPLVTSGTFLHTYTNILYSA